MSKLIEWYDSPRPAAGSRIPLLRLHWFTPGWWRYLLSGATGLRNVWCRARGHPYSVGWYNVGGLEPDMKCRNCGEDLG